MVMKTKHIILVIVILATLWFWNSSRNETYENSEAYLYAKNSDEPNPFIVYGMVKKQTSDEAKQKKALTLANEKKKSQLLEFLKTL